MVSADCLHLLRYFKLFYTFTSVAQGLCSMRTLVIYLYIMFHFANSIKCTKKWRTTEELLKTEIAVNTGGVGRKRVRSHY